MVRMPYPECELVTAKGTELKVRHLIPYSLAFVGHVPVM